MDILRILLISFAVAADAFAVSLTIGIKNQKANKNIPWLVGLSFGFFQGLMAFLGYNAIKLFGEFVTRFGPIIVFSLLSILGLRMIFGGLDKEKKDCKALSVKYILILAIATSLDALAVGVSFGFMTINVNFAIALIVIITFLLSILAVKLGCFIGVHFGKLAEISGGVILLFIAITSLIR